MSTFGIEYHKNGVEMGDVNTVKIYKCVSVCVR